MCADDTSLSYRSDDVHQQNEAMNKDLTTVSEWLTGNKLSLNVAKTKAMFKVSGFFHMDEYKGICGGKARGPSP